MERIGRYQIQRELGRGAMGVVFLATDPALDRPVVIKTIRFREVSDPQERQRLRDRLLQEARMAGALSHPHIVTVYDAGEQGDLTYIAMEYVNGPTLEQLLGREQPLDAAEALRILRETASALDYAHQKGIVHRDVKPANIMIHENGAVKITDFGIAKIPSSPLATQAGLVLGTPSYMSPEQALGRPVDGRSDQFSLAVIAFEMFTGEKPFVADEIPALLYRIAHEPPPSAHALNPTLGWPVDVVLKRAMEKGPAARYATCTEFVAALESACRASKDWRPLPRGASQTLPTVAAAPITAEPGNLDAGASTRPAFGRARETEGRRKDIVVTLFSALITIGLISLAVIWFLGRDHREISLPGPASNTEAQQASPAQRPSPAGPPVAAPKAATQAGEPSPVPATKPVQVPGIQPVESGADASSPTAPDSEPAPPAATKPVQTPAVQPAPPPPAKPTPAVGAQSVASSAKPATPPAPPAEDTIVTFNSTPSGATVVVNGDSARKCVTPCALTLPPGTYSAAAMLDGHRTAFRVFRIPEEPDITLTLARLSGKIRVSSNPPGAAIFVNGLRQRSLTPSTLELPTGKHTIAVEREGFPRAQQEIEVKDGAFVTLTFTLAR